MKLPKKWPEMVVKQPFIILFRFRTVYSSSEITTINPLIFLNNSFSESNDGNLQARDELKVPQIEDEHLGAIDTVCVWLRYKLKSLRLVKVQIKVF